MSYQQGVGNVSTGLGVVRFGTCTTLGAVRFGTCTALGAVRFFGTCTALGAVRWFYYPVSGFITCWQGDLGVLRFFLLFFLHTCRYDTHVIYVTKTNFYGSERWYYAKTLRHCNVTHCTCVQKQKM